MKLTKYAQSCILLETKGKRILIDPGSIQWEASLLEEWGHIDIVLVTHKHGDHCHAKSIQHFVAQGAKFYSSQEVGIAYPDLQPEIVQAGDILKQDGTIIEVVHAVHGYLPHLEPTNVIFENLGYIVDDGHKRVYHASDTVCFRNAYYCDVLLVPVTNHSLTMGPFAAARFSKMVGASLTIPIHCDNPTYPVDMGQVEEVFTKEQIKYKLLAIKESVEL
jgi:L-ascorbate metabolism protein UlaG (beta-lactamase superfamily)